MNYIPTEIFTQKDLDTNKQGMLTDEQKSKIDKYIAEEKSTGKYLGVFIAILFMGTLCIAYFSDDYIKHHINNFTFTGLTWLICCCLPWIIYFIANKSHKTPTQESYKIHSINGLLQKIYDGNHDGAAIIKINKTRFDVADDIYNMLENNTTYTVYYVKFTSWKMLLSWEKNNTYNIKNYF